MLSFSSKKKPPKKTIITKKKYKYEKIFYYETLYEVFKDSCKLLNLKTCLLTTYKSN